MIKFSPNTLCLKKNIHFITYQSICKVTSIIYIYPLNMNNSF